MDKRLATLRDGLNYSGSVTEPAELHTELLAHL
jgi:hypothetical protein